MTPPAVTATGRGSGVSGRRAASAAPSHRRALRHQPAPSRPRRISGPLRGRAAVAPATARPAPAARALGLIRSLPEHSLLDRLVRGRAWIPVLGVMLAGIVTMQVEVLKLGTSVGRWMQRASTLQTKNDALQASVASLADDQRIERRRHVHRGDRARPDGGIGGAGEEHDRACRDPDAEPAEAHLLLDTGDTPGGAGARQRGVELQRLDL